MSETNGALSLFCIFGEYEEAEAGCPGSFIGRGRLTLRSRRLGSTCRDRIYRTDHVDPVDVASSFLFHTLITCPRATIPAQNKTCA